LCLDTTLVVVFQFSSHIIGSKINLLLAQAYVFILSNKIATFAFSKNNTHYGITQHFYTKRYRGSYSEDQQTDTAQPQWGKMSVGQMLAHCNVSYEMVYEDKHPKPKGFVKTLLKLFVKNTVVGEAPYKKNTRTGPAFLITTEKDFETEKNRLTNYILKTQQLGEKEFDNKASHSFGNLNISEWNNMFYKHLDHHLSQFGV